ncbi:MAG: ATP-binding protein [Dehalococcoidia bacterium]
MAGLHTVPLNLAIALLVFSALGTLTSVYVLFVIANRHSRMRRSVGLDGDGGAAYDEQFALAGIENTAQSLVQRICRASKCHFAVLFLPHHGDDRLTVAATDGESSPFQTIELSYFHPLVRRLSVSGQPAEVGGGSDEIGLPPNSILFPTLSRGRLIAVLAVGPPEHHHAMGKRSRETIAQIVAQAAGQLENAQLYASLRRAFSDLEDAQRELLALQRVSVAAQSTLRLDEVLEQIAHGVEDGLAFDTATVYLVDTVQCTIAMPIVRGTSNEHVISAGPIPFDESNASIRALLAVEVFVTHDLRESILPRLIEAGALSARDLQPELTVVNLPLASKGRVIGGMALTTTRATVSERQIESLRTFAAQAAATIENARLYGQLETAYSDLRTAQEQLIRAERLRTLGQVAGGVAHDFNNILAAILTRAQLAQQQTRSPHLREALAVIEQAAMDGASIARRIQSLAKPRAEREPEAIDLQAVVQQALEFTQPMWLNAAQARGVKITTETSYDKTGTIEGHPSELREVITNLILNATAAMPDGGVLRLHTAQKDGYGWCSVEDTGTGMTDDVKKQVFDPFFSTKGAGGSGLGMSIVAAIVERHRGKIQVESELGRGTRIRVDFPISSVRALTQKPARRRGSVSLRLLIVDEDERTRDALSLILSRQRHRVATAATVEAGIRALVEEEFDVVITDLGLGEHSGWEVAEASKSLRPNAAVILVSAWAAQWEPEEARARGVDAVLAKPFTIEEVFSCLEKALVGAA